MPQHDCTKRKRRLSHEFNHLAGLIKPRSYEATTSQGAEDLREAGDSRLDADLEKFRKLGPNDIQLSEPHEVIAHALPLPETEIPDQARPTCRKELADLVSSIGRFAFTVNTDQCEWEAPPRKSPPDTGR